MNLILDRVKKDPAFTLGQLSLNDSPLCWVCEDTVREPGVKVPGKTAIPAGTYRITVTFSNRFRTPLPLLLNVPMFEGIRIHPGNTAADTEGCLLPGMDRTTNGVSQSRQAFKIVFKLIEDALERGEEVTITIR